MIALITIGLIFTIIYFIWESRNNRSNSFKKKRINEFYLEPSYSQNSLPEIIDLLNKKYTPRVGFEITIYAVKKNGYTKGDELLPVFKTKASYSYDYNFDVGFKHKGELISVESDSYGDKQLYTRMVKAYFSGYRIEVIINKVTKGIFLDADVKFYKGEKVIAGKSSRKKSTKSRGKFTVTGYHHLSDADKRVVWKELKVGDKLKLVHDAKNRYDNEAIMVFFGDIQIGWVAKKYTRKYILFNALSEGKIVSAVCIKNKRDQDYVGGNWQNKYLGMAQFVDIKFEFDK